MIKLTAVAGDITTSDADAIVVNLFDGVTSPSGATGAVDRALGGAISALIADNEITGKQNQISMIHTLGKLPTKRVIVLGLGRSEKFNVNVVRDVSGAVARYLRRIGVSRAATIAHGAGIGGLDASASAQAMWPSCRPPPDSLFRTETARIGASKAPASYWARARRTIAPRRSRSFRCSS